MKTVRVDFPASTAILWKNTVARNGVQGPTAGAAATIKSNQALMAGALFALASVDIAVNDEGIVQTAGRYALPKATAVAYSCGQLLGYDWANDRVTNILNGTGGVIGTVAEDAALTDTVVYVNINQGRAREWNLEIDPTTTDETNNYVDIDIGFDNTKVAPVSALFSTDSDGTDAVAAKIFRRTGTGNTTTFRVSLTDVVTGTHLFANFKQIAS